MEIGYQSYRMPQTMRRVESLDPDTGKSIVLVTNNLKLAASTLAAIYKERWQIETFFRTLKQNLRVKTFVGASPNAVHIQIWTALIAMLLLRYLHLRSIYPKLRLGSPSAVPITAAPLPLVLFQPGGVATPTTLRASRSLGVDQLSLPRRRKKAACFQRRCGAVPSNLDSNEACLALRFLLGRLK